MDQQSSGAGTTEDAVSAVLLAASLSRRLAIQSSSSVETSTSFDDDGSSTTTTTSSAKEDIDHSVEEETTPGAAASEQPVQPPTTESQVSSASDSSSTTTTGRHATAERRRLRRQRPLILCDLGYGFPHEERPRKEKLLAVAKQLVNYLHWQTSTAMIVQRDAFLDQSDQSTGQQEERMGESTTWRTSAQLLLVGCSDSCIQESLTDRMRQLWNQLPSINHIPLPTIEFSNQPLSSFVGAIYLSPDAPTALDATQPPPKTVVVGMLIDRRIQVNRSVQRAERLNLPTARLPLELVSDVLDPMEPLNVDCVLEGMQQWYWNSDEAATMTTIAQARRTSNNSSNSNNSRTTKDTTTTARESFERAASQALRHHQERHPGRPQHKT